MSSSLTEALTAWMLMVEQRLARIEIAVGLPVGPDPERPDDALP